MRFGNGPLKGQSQNATAPLLQQPFVPSTTGLPRPPRGGRASFSGGRGRGGHRNRSGNGTGFDPNVAGQFAYYGQAQAQYWGQQPMFDPMQAQSYNMQMYGRGPMPPPPQPQTVVPGLNMDPLRFYVLGQVSLVYSCAGIQLMLGGILFLDAESRHGFLPTSTGNCVFRRSKDGLTKRWTLKDGSLFP